MSAMKKVTEVLLRAFLRRYPVPTRLHLFGYLGRYAWLKDVLQELRPELFPPTAEAVVAPVEPIAPKPDDTVLGILERTEIRGRLGYYKATTYLGQRGQGHLFGAADITSKRPVIIKEFLLPATSFTKAEALQRQNTFKQLAGIQLADGRMQDFRLIQPIEAIADSESQERCFLVTDWHDSAPTLRQQLQRDGLFPLSQVREIASQILQTLDFLHKQKFSFPSGAIQNGLIHGNLSLDSVLWTAQQTQPFVYLTDLLLWEQCFDATNKEWRSISVTGDSVQQDLRAVGDIGIALLQGVNPDETIAIEPSLRLWLDSLRNARFDSAETARRALLQLSPRSPLGLTPPVEIMPQPPPPKNRFSPLLLLSLLGLIAGAFVLLPRLRSTEARFSPPLNVSTCCLAEVSAVPAGEFFYTSVENGTWWKVLQQRNLLQQGEGLKDALALAQPKLQLRYVPAQSLEQVWEQVRSGTVEFAVLPLIDELPGDLLSEAIAYDGLAAVVAFSYAERQQGLPAALKGHLRLEQIQQIYTGQVDQWRSLGGPPLPIQRYVSNNPEAIAIFQQRLLQDRAFETLPDVVQLPTIDLLRQVIRDFEEQAIGSIGFVPLSEIWGQCSVYPLALSDTGAAVQPMILTNGQDVTPATDLCDRKGAYGPASERFQTGSYPLSYPIVVVYPRDNRRSAVGKKFVELMRTIEGQRLLQAAGLVPLSQGRLARPSPAAAARR